MLADFDWDPAKATANLRKHGVSFGEAATAFGDPLGLDLPDQVHSSEEGRFLRLGRSYLGRLLVVAYSERQGPHSDHQRPPSHPPGAQRL